MWNMRKLNANFTDFSTKFYFCDADAIYDIIMEEPVRKWRHYYRHGINKDLLNNESFRPAELFWFFEKSTGPILPFVALALSFTLLACATDVPKMMTLPPFHPHSIIFNLYCYVYSC